MNATATALTDKMEETLESRLDFSEILLTYQDRVYNQTFRMLGNREDAEEATQDIFLSVHGALDNFRGDSKISTWIYRITSNECISRLRKKQLDMRSLDEPVGDDRDTMFGDFIPSNKADPEELLESGETAKLIRSKVRDLPPDWAMAVSLYHFDDLSYDEIAEVMGIPKATVATYIFRGRKKLANGLMKFFS